MSAQPSRPSHWPVFDLHLRTPRLDLAPVRESDLPAIVDAIAAGIHDPAVMPFATPFTDAPSPERERDVYRWYWRTWAGWDDAKWDLPFAVRSDGQTIGIQSLHSEEFPTLRSVSSGSWLRRDRQGDGLGKEMRAAVLHLAFEALGAEEATSESFLDNPASQRVSVAMGYEENGRDRKAPRGEPRELVRWRLTRERWERSRDEGVYPKVTVEGLGEACLALLGAA